MFKDFKEFAMKGNVVDMAVGVIIGAAFGKIISSLVADVIMPPLGKIIGNVDFSNLFYPLDDKARAAHSLKELTDSGGAAIKYGVFINTALDFVIVAFAIFLVVKAINKVRPAPPPPPPATKDCPQCAMPVPLKAVKCGHCQSAL
jgi:large conductance mechanosensitive channel